jgi:esterase/lipase
MKKRNKIALSIFVVFYISFGVFITLNQESIVYHPFPQDFVSCPGFEEAKKVTYQGTRMYVSETSGPTAVLYHGNAGSACNRDFYANLFTQANYSYIIVEYAGFSNDVQSPSHELIKQDVKNVISYLEKENVERVVVVGESIGTGFAAYHASIAPPKELLLISPFTDLKDVARGRFWFYPTSLLVDNALDNIEALHTYTGEVTIIHGTEDKIIPYKLGEKLYNSIQTEKNITPVQDAGHNNLFTFEETYSAINEFLELE